MNKENKVGFQINRLTDTSRRSWFRSLSCEWYQITFILEILLYPRLIQISNTNQANQQLHVSKKNFQ